MLDNKAFLLILMSPGTQLWEREMEKIFFLHCSSKLSKANLRRDDFECEWRAKWWILKTHILFYGRNINRLSQGLQKSAFGPQTPTLQFAGSFVAQYTGRLGYLLAKCVETCYSESLSVHVSLSDHLWLSQLGNDIGYLSEHHWALIRVSCPPELWVCLNQYSYAYKKSELSMVGWCMSNESWGQDWVRWEKNKQGGLLRELGNPDLLLPLSLRSFGIPSGFHSNSSSSTQE